MVESKLRARAFVMSKMRSTSPCRPPGAGRSFYPRRSAPALIRDRRGAGQPQGAGEGWVKSSGSASDSTRSALQASQRGAPCLVGMAQKESCLGGQAATRVGQPHLRIEQDSASVPLRSGPAV